MLDNSGLEKMSLMPGSNSISSSPLEKLLPVGGSINFSELPQILLSKGQKARTCAESPNSPVTYSGVPSPNIVPHSNAIQLNSFYYENSLFSSSLSETFGKLGLASSDTHFGKADVTDYEFLEGEPLESLKEIEAQTIGDLLPNDDDLLSGLIDDIECLEQANNGDEDDLFCSGGGMEMELDESFNKKSDFVCGVSSSCQIGGLNRKFTGELMHAKQTSRTLILKNIGSNIQETELKVLFEQFGDIRGLNTTSKNHGVVLVSYYDIRAARNAVRTLQDRLMRQNNVEINYFLPKDNSSERDRDNAIVITSNIDSSVSNDDIHRIFGSYGEIKVISRDTHNPNQRSIEFYDVRAADTAFSALSMGDIGGMRIKVEPGCSGAEWRCLATQTSSDIRLEGSTIGRNGGSPSSSLMDIGVPSRTMAYGANTLVDLDNKSTTQSLSLQTLSNSVMERKLAGISSTVPQSTTSPSRATMAGNHGNQSNFDELSHSLEQMNIGFRSMPTFLPHSLPKFANRLISGTSLNTARAIPSMGININSARIAEGMDGQQNRLGTGHINGHSFEHKEGNAISPINGHQYIQNNSNTNFHHPPSSLIWQSPTFVNNIPARSPQLHGLPRGGPSYMMNTFVPPHHHVGSAPALNPWGRHTTCAGECMEAPSFHPGSLGNIAFSRSFQMHPFQIASHSLHPHDCRNCIDHRSHMLQGMNSLNNSAASSYDASGHHERIRSRRSDAGANQVDNKKQFELDINRIIRGEDSRTTLMIKNIPNKYTSKMLLATIDECHKGTYDFIYLPIDFKNKCNVGYAFINMNDPKHIIPFHQALNGKKWEKFNSEKVASLAYARIQGKAALVAHFQNSSLMNEDKRCRPILFHSDGPKAGDQEAFPMGAHIRSRPGRPKTTSNDERSPPESGDGDCCISLSNTADSSCSSSFNKEPSFGMTYNNI